MRKRIHEYDLVRTIATYSVIIVHITAMGIVGFEHYSPHSLLTIFINRMLKYTTPVFIYLAGALIYASYKNKPFKYGHFIKSRSKRILIPYTLVSAMYYLLTVYLTGGVISVKTFALGWLTGSSQYHLYFIPIIIQMYLLTPVFLYLKEKVNLKYLMPVIGILSYLGTLFFKFPYSDRIFIKFLIPYTLGLYFGDQALTWLKALSKKVYILIAITFAFGVYYTYEFVHYFYGQPSLEILRDTGWFFYCILAIFVLTYIATQIKNEKLIKGSSHLSKISYYIYLLHPLFLAGSERTLNRMGIYSTSLRLVFHLILVISISTMVAHLIYKFNQWNLYKHFKGLSPLSRRIVSLVLLLVILVGGIFSYQLLVEKGYMISIESHLQSIELNKLYQEAISSDIYYENKAYGYRYHHEGYDVIDENERVRTRFVDDHTSIDVYYEYLDGLDSSKSFTNYSNTHVVDSDYIHVLQDDYILFNDDQVRLLTWEREKLKHVPDDYNNYASIDIIKNEQEVYNIYVRSKEPIDPMDYLLRFETIAKEEATLKQMTFNRQENKSWSDETKAYYQKQFVESDLTWGLFDPRVPTDFLAPIEAVEEAVDHTFDYVLHYSNLDTYINMNYYNTMYEAGKIFEYTLQTSEYYNPTSNATFMLLEGKFDDKLREFAQALKALDGPVLFRLNNEMNGDWCYYNAFFFQKDTDLYKAVWYHIYDIFEAEGADNVLWIFNPNEKDLPGYKWNHYSNYFPGEEYVDIIGVTGYNTGNYLEHEVWRDFDTIYDEFMPEYKEVFKDYAFMITEFGSSIYGGDKVKWTKDMLEKIEDYGFKIAIYWNSIDRDPADPNKEARVYRFHDDPDVVQVFLEYFKKY